MDKEKKLCYDIIAMVCFPTKHYKAIPVEDLR